MLSQLRVYVYRSQIYDTHRTYYTRKARYHVTLRFCI